MESGVVGQDVRVRFIPDYAVEGGDGRNVGDAGLRDVKRQVEGPWMA